MKEIEVNVYSIVGNSFCVDAEDGEKVFEVLKKVIEQNNSAIISFLNVEMLTSAFLNTAVGRLYGVFDHDLLKNRLSLKDISNDDKLLLKKVTDTAKAYYKNKEKNLVLLTDDGDYADLSIDIISGNPKLIGKR